MENPNLGTSGCLVIARLQRAPGRARGGCLRADLAQTWVRRDGNSLPDHTRTKTPQYSGRAADVIWIAMRQHERVDCAHAERAERRANDALADVEGRARQTAGIDEQDAPIRQLRNR